MLLRRLRRLATAAALFGCMGCDVLGPPGSPDFFDSGPLFAPPGYDPDPVIGLEPYPLPTAFTAGTRLRVVITSMGPYADPKYAVKYIGSPPYVQWLAPDPPCPQNTCAELVASTPTAGAYAFVGIEVCETAVGICTVQVGYQATVTAP